MSHTHSSDTLLRETIQIASDTDGIMLALHHCTRHDLHTYQAERTIMLMHGATFPAVSLFDVPVGGASFMATLAEAGFDVWAVDARGYGSATRPLEMTQPSESHAPLTPARVAARDLHTAIEHVCHYRCIDTLNLVAMSWGGSVAGCYINQHAERVDKLTLVAPQWLSDTPLRIDQGQPLTAWRAVDVRAFETLWLAGVPEAQRADFLPQGGFDAWATATLATDTESQAGTIRAPGGAIADTRLHWRANDPLWQPEQVHCPVLLIHAEWDQDVRQDMMMALFKRFTNAPYRRWVEIGASTHMVLMEPNRWQAFDAIVGFLKHAS